MSEDALLVIFTYCPPINLKKNYAAGEKSGRKSAKKYPLYPILSKGNTSLLTLAL